MLFKLINNYPQPFKGRYIRYNGRIYANPTEDQLRLAGWKSLITSEQPPERDGYYIEESYSETDITIVQHWTEYELSPEEQAAMM